MDKKDKFENIGLSEFGKKYLLDKRKLSPGEDKIRKSDMNKGMPPGGLDKDKEKKAKKKYDPTKANRAGQKMGQRKAGGQIKKMAYGGMAKKKMMGGGMALKYGHGGTVTKGKKCPRDGIAMRGKTRA